MPIELSGITFTEQGDFIGEFGEDEILNNGFANTLAGNDLIIGNSENSYTDNSVSRNLDWISGVYNSGTFNTDDGNDFIMGTGKPTDLIFGSSQTIISGIYNIGTLNMGDGNDEILGIRYKQSKNTFNDDLGYGIHHRRGLIDTGEGDDIITGFSNAFFSHGIHIYSGNSFSDQKGATINTGNGNDTITGTGNRSGIEIFGFNKIPNNSSLDTGNGNDIITGTGIDFGIHFSTENDSIDTGKGDDIITGTGNLGIGIYSSSSYLNTGEGNDTITGIAYVTAIYNKGTISTGDGNDVISSGTNTSYEGFILNDGTINTGNGEDSLIADSGFYGNGNVFLGNDTDYLRGFGYGNFNGGNDQDSLELTPGSYTVGISGAVVSFTKGNRVMKTSEFEKLIAGSTTYDFTSLTDGQTILAA